MARWEPDAAGRLRAAALDLYVEQGYQQTTVAEIAERAGLTARTFFRHFADKREVLFAGADVLGPELVAAVEAAPAEAPVLEVVALGLDALAALIGGDVVRSRRRQSVIAANPELQERELNKMARLSATLREALGRRGVADAEAQLAAEAGITVFRIGFECWVAGPDDGDLAVALRESLDRLCGLMSRGAAGWTPPTRRA